MSQPDFLEAVDRSGLLTGSEFLELRARVRRGACPSGGPELARHLVGEGLLTDFQARRLLKGKVGGLVIGRYTVLDRIGVGGMGCVFKARHQLMDRVAAIKVISAEYSSRTNAVARFLREMKLVGQMDHPNVIRAYDADMLQAAPYLVMEYLRGEDLKQMFLRRGPLPPEEVVGYMAQAARGLAHAHERGVIHRDVKPSNLFVDDGGCVKVLDLGLGGFADEFRIEAGSPDLDHGQIVGTAEYISPEQVTGGTIDGRTDIFSLGCTMYLLLTGALPFPGESRTDRLTRRIDSRHVPITDHRDDLPYRMIALIDRLLDIRPEHRLASAAEAAEALEDLTARRVHPSGGRRAGPPTPASATAADPPLDWAMIDAALSTKAGRPREGRPADGPEKAEAPDRGPERLDSYRRGLEETGEGSGRDVHHHYFKELGRLNRAGPHESDSSDTIEKPLLDRWVDRLAALIEAYLSEPAPTHILVAILAIILALSVGLYLTLG